MMCQGSGGPVCACACSCIVSSEDSAFGRPVPVRCKQTQLLCRCQPTTFCSFPDKHSSSVNKRQRLAQDFLSVIDQTGELLSLVEEEDMDEVKQERLEVRKRSHTHHDLNTPASGLTCGGRINKYDCLDYCPSNNTSEVFSYLSLHRSSTQTKSLEKRRSLVSVHITGVKLEMTGVLHFQSNHLKKSKSSSDT